MLNFLKNIFDENKKALDRYQMMVDQINELESEVSKKTDKQLAGQTKKLRQQIEESRNLGKKDAEILDELLPEAFATVRETSQRLLGMKHYDVQLLAGIALHHGFVTEQKTGEGKTLTVTAPLYLNALLGKGAHLVTVNDYLAEIGVGWMGPIYDFLGMTASVIVHDRARLYNPDVDSEERGDERLEHFQEIARKAAYATDITYGTNNEFGFDYLRDNMVQNLDQMVQRQHDAHHFAIVDEADSILIDEARTPLIISAPDSDATDKYFEYSQLVRSLTKEQDFKIDEKARSVTLTDLGVKRIEQKLKVKNLYEESYDTIHHVESALKANSLYKRDTEYIVRENQVVIVDEHTGRLMYGRRYSDGLHQAIEAKEQVAVQQESRTLATISIQNYFRQYKKLSGMTGTAATEVEEFRQIYSMDVLVIPTNREIIREDKVDVVYKTTAAKYSAIARAVEEIHQSGRPILIGTRSIDHNQIVSDFLNRKHIKHQVLNAKNNEREAFIIADAGKKNAITVATNIAGRGVDIVLGGSKPELKDYRKSKKSKKFDAATIKKARKDAEKMGVQLPPAVNPLDYKISNYAKAVEQWQKSHDGVVAVGGLFILGTERHESRRIDNQLRGRSGRQGDPGTSQFFLALEDEIMRIFGGEQIKKMMDFLKIEEDQPIEHGMVSKSIESAQVKVEGFFFDQRKRLVDFDDVMNRQREIIYRRRRRLLEQSSELELDEIEADSAEIMTLRDQILSYVRDEIKSQVSLRAPEGFTDDEFDAIIKEFVKTIPFDAASQRELFSQISKYKNVDEIIEKLSAVAEETYEAREKVVGDEGMRQIERYVTLSTVDEKWMDHLDEMDNLRDGIWLRGDKNTVLSEYKKEAFASFELLISLIESTIANRVYRVHLHNQPRVVVRPEEMTASKESINEPLAKEISDATPPSGKNSSPRSTSGSLNELASAMGTATAVAKKLPGVKKEKISRNDPCPCGSGLKYKKCGLINAPQHKG